MLSSSLLRQAASMAFAAGLFLASGCDQGSKVRSTVPADGEEGVDAKTKIRITFTNTFNSNADATEKLTEAANVRVTGTKTSAPYSGTLKVMSASAAAAEAKASQTAGATTNTQNPSTQTPAKAIATKNAAADPTATTTGGTQPRTDTGKTTTTAAATTAATAAASAQSSGQTENDTLLFTLSSGSFKAGETIHVQVGGNITVRGVPIDDYRFSFRIAGEDTRPVISDFRVVSTTPVAEQVGVALRPRISASFSQSANPTGIADGIVLRGEHSGVHKAGETLFPSKESDQKVLQVAQRLEGDDQFLPGEWVTVTLSADIQAAAAAAPAAGTKDAGAATAASLLAGTGKRLPPYRYRFQVVTGKVSGPWTSVHRAGPPRPSGITSGNLRPIVDGTEFVTFAADRADIFSQKEGGGWDQATLQGFNRPGKAVDAVVSDLDGGGTKVLKLVVLGTADTDDGGSWVNTYIVGTDEKLRETERDATFDIPASHARRLFVADIDANGFADIIVVHPSRDYLVNGTATTAATTTTTGTLTIIEKSRDPTKIDTAALTANPTDTSILKGTPALHRVDNPIPDLKLIARLELHDLDGDGRPDIIAEAAGEGGGPGQLLIIQNRGASQGTLAERFLFTIQRPLRARGGSGSLVPRSWTAADLDGDQDIDILAWDDAGALLYRNSLDPRTQDPAKPVVRGLLFEDVVPVAVSLPPARTDSLPAVVMDLNGDGALDVVLADGERRAVRVFPGVPGQKLQFSTPQEIGAGIAGRLIGLAVADADGDSGPDFIVLGDGADGGQTVDVIHATGVEPPGTLNPSRFTIDPETSVVTDQDIQVALKGDIAETFTGYTLVLDYDEAKLAFTSFEPPTNLNGIADFTPCPDSKGQGCAGFASVKAVIKQNSHVRKGDGILLGTFHLKPKPVTLTTRTSITLVNGLDSGDGKTTLSNSLTTVDGQAQSTVEVELGGEPFVVSLEPPPPPLLAITACETMPLSGGVFPARVAWNSPADALFSRFEVYLDGALLEVLDSLARETEPFHLNTGGIHPVKVVGIGLDGVPAASADCSLSAVFKPEVSCNVIDTTGGWRTTLITWSIAGTVSGFQLSRNGVVFSTVEGTVLSKEDTAPTKTGAVIYQVAGVLNQADGTKVVGPVGSCIVDDPNPARTDPPASLRIEQLVRQTSGDPISLRMKWTNAEAYDKLRLRVFPDPDDGKDATALDLPGTATEYVWTGDPLHGGVPPQVYRFSLRATSAAVDSDPKDATSFPISVVVPPLGDRFTCEAPVGSEVRLTWSPVWGGYTGLTLSVKEPQGTRQLELPLTEIEHLDSVVPVGNFEYTLTARYETPLPPSLRPNLTSLQRKCTIAFNPLLRLGKVETGIGLGNVLVPVRADLFAPIRGVRFALDLPSVLQIDLSRPTHPETAVRLNGPAGGATLTVSLGAAPPGGDGKPRQRIEVAVEDGSFPAGKDQVLLWVVGAVAPDFTLAGDYLLSFDGVPEILLQGEEGKMAIASDDSLAGLTVRKRYIVVDRASAQAGASQPMLIRVLATFDKPEGFDLPEDYRMIAYTIHFKWEPSLLELQPILKSDQIETEVGTKGSLFVPQGGAFETARQKGDIGIGWIGLLGNPGAITPGILKPLLYLFFKPRVPDNPAGAFGVIDLVDPPLDQPTILFPEDVPNDGPVIEARFDGGIDIAPPRDIPTLVTVSPAYGSLAGGGEALVNGFGFLAGVTDPGSQVQVLFVYRPPGSPQVIRKAEWIPGRPFKDNLLEFKVPSAGLTSPSLFATKYDVEIRTPNGRSILPDAYQYEFLRVSAANRSSGGVSGGDLMTITGFGMAPLTGDAALDTTVEFRVQGAGAPVLPAEVLGVDPDGRKLNLRTPAFPGQAGKQADVYVVLPSLRKKDGTAVSDKLAAPFLITSGPEIVSISPDSGLEGGGTVVTIEVTGFPAPLNDGVAPAILFGSVPGVNPTALGQSTVRAASPPGTGAVQVSVSHGGFTASRDGGFLYNAANPRILSVSLLEGPVGGGTKVSIQSADFTGTGSFQVLFGDQAGTGVSAAGSVVTATTPPHARGEVAVKLRRGSLEAVHDKNFLYRDPKVLSLSPSRGPVSGGAEVSIQIQDFGTFAQNPTVRFGSSPATVTSSAPDHIQAVVPSAAAAGAVAVTVSYGPYSVTFPGAFTYEVGPGPQLTAVEQAVGTTGTICGGETLTLRGSGFASGMIVRFKGDKGSALAQGVRVLGAGAAEATTPPVEENFRTVDVGVSGDGVSFSEKAGAFAFKDLRAPFVRGDTDGDGSVKLNDAIAISSFITGTTPRLPNPDAADANDDGQINTGDVSAITGLLFGGATSLPAPYPNAGQDLTPDRFKGCD